MKAAPRTGGFTLIEVLVALVIVTFGIGALLTTLTSSADSVTYLRDKSLAEWIALNRLAELRLGSARPSVGHSHGEIEYAGSRWRWDQEVIDPGIAGIRRVDIGVMRLEDGAAQDGDEAPAALAVAFGFLGEAVADASGFTPDWSYQTTGGSPSGDEDEP